MLTSQKKLRSGTPLWAAHTVKPLPLSLLTQDISTDVAIIGAGISGALMAEELTSLGLSVVLLDRREPMRGSTLATTALLQYEIDVPLIELTKKIGYADAVCAWRRSRLSLQSLADRTVNLEIPCDLERKTSLYLQGDSLGCKKLSEEKEMRLRASLQCTYASAAEVKKTFAVCNRAALVTQGNFAANPLLLTHGYLEKAIERGARIFSHAETINVTPFARHVRIETKQGHTITARHAVFCTGYEVPKPLQRSGYRIFSTWALATKPRIAPAGFPMIWEASDPYLYLRSTPDGRIICGGEDEEFSDEKARDALIKYKIATLEKKATRLLGKKIEADYAWCGSFGVTPTGLPMAGRVPRMKNCYAVLAFGGNGIVGSRIGAEIVGSMLSGLEDPDARLYRF